MSNEKENNAIPRDAVVDDSNTVEGQLISAHAPPRVSKHMLFQIKKYLSDVHYPSTKSEIYAAAKDQGAPDTVLQALSTLQQRSYDSFEELNSEVARQA